MPGHVKVVDVRLVLLQVTSRLELVGTAIDATGVPDHPKVVLVHLVTPELKGRLERLLPLTAWGVTYVTIRADSMRTRLMFRELAGCGKRIRGTALHIAFVRSANPMFSRLVPPEDGGQRSLVLALAMAAPKTLALAVLFPLVFRELAGKGKRIRGTALLFAFVRSGPVLSRLVSSEVVGLLSLVLALAKAALEALRDWQVVKWGKEGAHA
jgi:hypothetical protein